MKALNSVRLEVSLQEFRMGWTNFSIVGDELERI